MSWRRTKAAVEVALAWLCAFVLCALVGRWLIGSALGADYPEFLFGDRVVVAKEAYDEGDFDFYGLRREPGVVYDRITRDSSYEWCAVMYRVRWTLSPGRERVEKLICATDLRRYRGR